MGNMTKVVFWSGNSRWHQVTEAAIVTIRNQKIVEAEKVTAIPKGYVSFPVTKKSLEDLLTREGVWKELWEVSDE